MTLSDGWVLAVDPENKGKAERWYLRDRHDEARPAPVPGIIQEVFPDYHGVVWYWHAFTPEGGSSPVDDWLLKCEFVDYYAEFWMNGTPIGSHEGGEMPFALDATAALRPGARNVLAVRLINPTDTPIDGIVLEETPHRNKPPRGISAGASYNYGGILAPVHLVKVPKARIVDVHLKPDVATGAIAVTIAVENATAAPAAGRLSLLAGPSAPGSPVATAAIEVHAAPGIGNVEASLQIPQHRLWSPDDPFLYAVSARLEARADGRTVSHEVTARCGFRDFRVEKGYFRLNGRRVFLRCTHTGNHVPATQVVGLKHLRQDLVYAKASGFNAVRFISGAAFREQLDYCDEIGLMVYEECSSAWLLKDSPALAERFDGPTLGMIRRDRNHPSVVIWGLLNETQEGPVARHARGILPKVRALDDTRLVLYSSGRWDCQLGVGSLCNPGSAEWEFGWGAEAPGKAPMPREARHAAPWSPEHDFPGGLFEQMGDIHVYPLVPQSKANNRLIRTVGKDTGPVFLSEYGIGSQLDVIRHARQYEQIGARGDLLDAAFFRSMAERLEADWRKFGMEGVYPFAADFLHDSQRQHARLRTFTFDLLRSNPKICGYNLTGMLDHGFTGEGLWNFFREWKPGIVDALQDGWAPLRWCLFVEPMHAYAGKPLRVEAVLANEDVLPPGDYPVCFRITGQEGILWERRIVLNVPRPAAGTDGPLALPAIDEEVTLRISSGTYQLTAYMERGGAPQGGRLAFFVSDRKEYPAVTGSVRAWGLQKRTERWLASRKITCKGLAEPDRGKRTLILVGDLSKLKTSADDWKRIAAEVAAGSTAVFLSSAAFKRGDDRAWWLPLAKKGRILYFTDWLYHKDIVAKAHPYFDGLPGRGLLNIEYFDKVIGHDIFDGQDTPDEVCAAAFATGYPTAGGYASGLSLGAYRVGNGRIVLNTFRLEENLDAHPAADRMLLNIVAAELPKVRGAAKKPPRNLGALLRTIGYDRT